MVFTTLVNKEIKKGRKKMKQENRAHNNESLFV